MVSIAVAIIAKNITDRSEEILSIVLLLPYCGSVPFHFILPALLKHG